jgi:hypothetical protein
VATSLARDKVSLKTETAQLSPQISLSNNQTVFVALIQELGAKVSDQGYIYLSTFRPKFLGEGYGQKFYLSIVINFYFKMSYKFYLAMRNVNAP